MPRARAALVVLVLAVLGALPAAGHAAPGARHSLRAPVTDERFYFVMADRFENGTAANDDGGLGPDKAVSGLDPTATGWYHGGDLKGIQSRLDYIKGLGTTSIWLTPSFKNKAVQTEDNSAGYHGYWITDFTQIDPHLGTNDDLKALITAAHARGMKVYFDIITNHTADVIGYQEGARKAYVSKDAVPYRTAAGEAFDDRDWAGSNAFPELSAATSFPYHPVLEPGEEDVKVPAWLNDVTLYHNRGDTTFTGEDSQYGDFFGLDDLFTENPKVVQGFIDVYEKWVGDFGVDGFRIDTMKHVDDAFWQRFGPEVLRYARAHGKREFFMFGEVFDTTKSFTSQYVTHNRMQAVLDFPFQAAAQGFAADGKPTDALRDFFEGDDWYTDADSNAYQLPTFLGNHDMGRIGRFIDVGNPGISQDERLQRDQLAHALMYLSRGNPVVYYGDEQGFVGDGGDQGARQDMFPSQVASYNDDDLIGTDATTAQSNFDTTHPLYRTIAALAKLRATFPALDDGAQQHRWSSPDAGVYAFSRIDRQRRREFVVAVNNAKTAQAVDVQTYGRRGQVFTRVWGESSRRTVAGADGTVPLVVPALSAVVYRMSGTIRRPARAPQLALEEPAPAAAARGRMQVTADVDGSSFYEVTFQARVGNGGWEAIGTDDNAPYRVLHDVSDVAPGTQVAYRAIVRTLGGRTRASDVRTVQAPEAAVTLTAPARGRGSIPLSAVVDPEHADDVVTFQRRVGDGEWTDIGSDSSSPAYTFTDDVGPLGLTDGQVIQYRAVLSGTAGPAVTSEARSVELVLTPVTTAVVHYLRPAGDYTGWGLHLWGDAVDPALIASVAWDNPMPPTAFEDGWARFDLPLVDDTAAVNFIIHQPSGDAVPTTREPGGDRSFVPLQTPEVWLVAGDPTIYASPPAAAVARARSR